MIGGKNSEFENKTEFMAIDKNNIYKIDPWMKQFLINKKEYKTDV